MDFKLPQPSKFEGTVSGKQHVADWLFACKQYFAAMNYPASHWALAAATMLTGPALRWWRLTVMTKGIDPLQTSWEVFVCLLEEQYVPKNEGLLARDRLAALCQTSTMEVYVDQFLQCLLCINPQLDELSQVHLFIRGLKRKTALETRLRYPTGLNEAIKIAMDVDIMTNSPTNFMSPQVASNKMEIEQVTMTPLTDEERARLRKVGGCFYCRKPGHLAKDCPKSFRRAV